MKQDKLSMYFDGFDIEIWYVHQSKTPQIAGEPRLQNLMVKIGKMSPFSDHVAKTIFKSPSHQHVYRC